jgi:transposase, IS5 family
MRALHNSRISFFLHSKFASRGLSIHEGVAIDARLVQSASRPLSTEKREEEIKKRGTPEGTRDKNGNTLKFSRDVESDWTIKNRIPLFGLKEHAAVDTRYGFLLATELTPASHHDSPYLPLCVAGSCHTNDPVKKVYADKGYFGEPNRTFLAMNGIADGIMRKAVKGTDLTASEVARNKAISKVRYIVEQYFGLTHLHNGASRARFTTIAKNATDALFRQFAFNLRRGTRVVAA